MSLEPQSAALALHRFGLGPRRGSIAAIASDPRGALLAELDRPNIGRIDGSHLMSSAVAVRAAFEFRAERRARQVVAQREAEERKRAMGSADPNAMAPAEAPTETAATKPGRAQCGARYRPRRSQRALCRGARRRDRLCRTAGVVLVQPFLRHRPTRCRVSPAPMSARRSGPTCSAASATCCSPPKPIRRCCFYLDNAASIGPNSVAGINRSRGLNENLAREILELHTLGVRTGYTPGRRHQLRQGADRLELHPRHRCPSTAASSRSSRACTSPAPQTVLGKTYATAGIEQGRAVLADLARHPATAEHIAFKLAHHFVADEPPPALVERLAQDVPCDTDGNLKEMARALVDRAGILGRPAQQAQDVRRVDRRRPARGRRRPSRTSNGCCRRMPCSASRCGGRRRRRAIADDQAAWLDGMAQRLDIANLFATPGGGGARSAGAGRRGARPAGVGRNAPDHRPRRKPHPGASRCC